MPVEILTREQGGKYGKFTEAPSNEQLAKYFWFDNQDKNVIFNHRHDYNRLGFALQLGIVRFLGTFLSAPFIIPDNVVVYVAQQLNIDPGVLSLYVSDKNIQNHRNEIRQIYGYRDFNDQPFHFKLVRWLYIRSWISVERPSVLFDLATAKCIENKILLPGVTVMERLIAQVRDRANVRFWKKLAQLPNQDQREMLENLLRTDHGSRSTGLDVLRQSPAHATANGLLKAIHRLERFREIGSSHWNLSGIPTGRITALSRYAFMARAQTIERMNHERCIATLVSFVIVFTIRAQDDVIEVMEIIFTNLFRKFNNKGDKKRLRTIKDLDSAARKLKELCALLLDEQISDAELRETIFSKFPKEVLQASLQTVDQLTKPHDLAVAHEELFRNYTNIRKFLPKLMSVLHFQSTPSGQQALQSWDFLAQSECKSGKNKYKDAPLQGMSAAWKKLVMKDGNDKINPCAYTFWMIEQMNEAIKRHDIYIESSERYGDPRAQLLQGDSWDSIKPHVLRTLGWPSSANEALRTVAAKLDETYLNIAESWESNTDVRIENGRGTHYDCWNLFWSNLPNYNRRKL